MGAKLEGTRIDKTNRWGKYPQQLYSKIAYINGLGKGSK